jgi:hypothetical protein
MSETRILISLLWMYFTRNWEFGSALSKLRNFGGGGEVEIPKTLPPPYATVGGPRWEFHAGPLTVDLEDKYYLPHIRLLPPDDGLQMGPIHVEAWWFSKVKINSASCWFILQIKCEAANIGEMVGNRRKIDINGNPSLCYVSLRLNTVYNKVHALNLLQYIKMIFIE